jgi:hypothetical protein
LYIFYFIFLSARYFVTSFNYLSYYSHSIITVFRLLKAFSYFIQSRIHAKKTKPAPEAGNGVAPETMPERWVKPMPRRAGQAEQPEARGRSRPPVPRAQAGRTTRDAQGRPNRLTGGLERGEARRKAYGYN